MGEADNKNIFSNFLSFVEILAMFTSYCNKAYQFVKSFKKTKRQTLQISG